MLQLAFARAQTLGDLAQRFGLRELTEQHRHQLSPIAETARITLGLMFLHCCFEAVARDQLQNLAEDAAYSFQGEASLVRWRSFLQELNPNYQRLRPST